MVTRRVIRITAAEAAAEESKASSTRTVEGSGRNTFTNDNEIDSSRQVDGLPRCDLKQSKSIEDNTVSLKEVATKKDYDPTEGPSTSSNKSKKRKRSNSFTIDLGDVPPQSPIPKNKRDGRTKGSKSKYTGVSWNTKMKKWIAKIDLEGKMRYIGNYENEEEAGIDYARAVYKYKGKEAITKSKKSFTIDLSDVPPQSPITTDKSDGRMKNCTSKYTGVFWNKQKNKWGACISIEGKSRCVGFYENEEEAGIDYARAVYKYKLSKEANKNLKKRGRKSSFNIDLSDVPPQSPITRDKSDGRMKKCMSKYTGVSWNKRANKWHAQIFIEGKVRHVGFYNNEEDAGTDYARTLYKYNGKEELNKARVQVSQIKLSLSDVPSISPILNSGKRGTGTSSRYVGVCFDKRRKKWMSQIRVEGKHCCIGHYESEEKAAIDYARAVLKYRGQEALENARKQAAQCECDKIGLNDVPSI